MKTENDAVVQAYDLRGWRMHFAFNAEKLNAALLPAEAGYCPHRYAGLCSSTPKWLAGDPVCVGQSAAGVSNWQQ